jgi:hypothetical protein
LEVEVVVDGGMSGEKMLRRARRSKTTTPSFPTVGRLVRNFSPVGRSATGHMAIGKSKIAQSRTVGLKSIGDNGVGHVSLPF